LRYLPKRKKYDNVTAKISALIFAEEKEHQQNHAFLNRKMIKTILFPMKRLNNSLEGALLNYQITSWREKHPRNIRKSNSRNLIG
jgi:hypothetical protein